MRDFLNKIYETAKADPKHIILTDGDDERVLEAAVKIHSEGLAKVTLLGNAEKINQLAASSKFDLNQIEIIDPEQNHQMIELLEDAYEKILTARGKEFTEKDKEAVKSQAYFGTLMVEIGKADGMVTGARASTGDSILPALKIIAKKEKFQKVSGAFIMKLDERLLIFADTAVTIDPEAIDLVDIAEDSVETAKSFGIDPKVAFLSFSTKGSANHPSADKMARAASIFADRHPDIPSDGELQADAALVPEIAMRKMQVSEEAADLRPLRIHGDATILIFPDLNSANIAYKLVERLAKARAIGPILQGLTKPINDLSRGCSVQDIVDLTAMTVIEAQRNNY